MGGSGIPNVKIFRKRRFSGGGAGVSTILGILLASFEVSTTMPREYFGFFAVERGSLRHYATWIFRIPYWRASKSPLLCHVDISDTLLASVEVPAAVIVINIILVLHIKYLCNSAYSYWKMHKIVHWYLSKHGVYKRRPDLFITACRHLSGISGSTRGARRLNSFVGRPDSDY